MYLRLPSFVGRRWLEDTREDDKFSHDVEIESLCLDEDDNDEVDDPLIVEKYLWLLE